MNSEFSVPIRLSRCMTAAFVLTSCLTMTACQQSVDNASLWTENREVTANGIIPKGSHDLFLNPFNKFSAHHRPIGAGAEMGVPGGTKTLAAPHPTYDAPEAIRSRGRLANVARFQCGDTEQGIKYVYRVSAHDGKRNVMDTSDAPRDNKLPFELRMPGGVVYPSTSGDDVILLWPRNGKSIDDIADLLFNFESTKVQAKLRREYPLGGTDVADPLYDWDRGSSASGLRLPGTVLRGFEINDIDEKDEKSLVPIHHALNVAATRHNKVGACKFDHILGKSIVWPAYSKDGGADDTDANLGDIPYGTRVFIPAEFAHLRDSDTLGLSARGKILFDTLSYYGFYIIDGHGQYVNDKDKPCQEGRGRGILQLRIDQEISKKEIIRDIDESLQKVLPYLYPLRNPRRHAAETELHGGLPFAGGGGPLPPNGHGAGSFNNAYDAH